MGFNLKGKIARLLPAYEAALNLGTFTAQDLANKLGATAKIPLYSVPFEKLVPAILNAMKWRGMIESYYDNGIKKWHVIHPDGGMVSGTRRIIKKYLSDGTIKVGANNER